jgi:hypothetical protein
MQRALPLLSKKKKNNNMHLYTARMCFSIFKGLSL